MMFEVPPPLDTTGLTAQDSGGWTPVRESWTEAPRSAPPPLPASARVPVSRADDAFADTMLARLAASDYAGALMAAEALLHVRPNHADALDCRAMARTELERTYVARLGGALDRVPYVAMGAEALASLHLDMRAGFVLSRIDGMATLFEIAHSGGIAPLDALRILSELALSRAIAFEA